MIRHLAAPALLAVGGLLLTACGSSGDPQAAEAGLLAEQQRSTEMQLAQSEAERARNYAALPDRPPGVVEIDGQTGADQVTRRISTEYDGTDGTQVITRDSSEQAAFDRLCGGEIDLVASGAPIQEAEWSKCRSAGLDVIQFQVASDAFVVATKSETDIGGECLTTAQVRDMYRAGSPVTSWSHVGMDSVPMHVGGPTRDLATFAFFSDLLLDVREPSYANLRSDYRAFDTDRGIRTFVIGTERDQQAALRYPFEARRVAELRRVRDDARQVLDAAKREAAVARSERDKGVRDGRPADQQQRDQARLDTALTELATAEAAWQDAADAARAGAAELAVARKARNRDRRTAGRVAFFRHSYYALFEDQLRPFEITATGDQRNCVFASPWTITSGQYPLSRQFLLTTTSRSLEREEVQKYLDFTMRRAQHWAAEEQLVPLPNSVIARQTRWVTGNHEPAIVVPDSQIANNPAAAESTAPSKPVR